MSRWLIAWRVAIVCAVLLGLVNSGAERYVPVGQPQPPGSPGQSPSLVFERTCTPQTQSRALGTIVEGDLGEERGDYAVAILNLDTGESYMLNGERRMPAGSIYKLGVLYSVWREIRLGDLSLSDPLTITQEDAVEPEPEQGLLAGASVTVGDALRAMITVSSNAGAHALIRIVGRESVNQDVAALGLRDTILQAPGVKTGVVDATGAEVVSTSARDVLCLMTRVADGELLGPGPSGEMRQLLFKTGRTDRIPVLLPPTLRVAHKTGEIPGVRNDVAIVYAPHNTYVLAVLSQHPDEGEAMTTIARLSRKIYDYFVG